MVSIYRKQQIRQEKSFFFYLKWEKVLSLLLYDTSRLRATGSTHRLTWAQLLVPSLTIRTCILPQRDITSQPVIDNKKKK